MRVKEINFLASQAFYGLCVSNKKINTIRKARPLIKLSLLIAKEMLLEEKRNKKV